MLVLLCMCAGGEGLSYKVGDPITDIIVMHHDEASLIAVQGVVY